MRCALILCILVATVAAGGATTASSVDGCVRFESEKLGGGKLDSVYEVEVNHDSRELAHELLSPNTPSPRIVALFDNGRVHESPKFGVLELSKNGSDARRYALQQKLVPLTQQGVTVHDYDAADLDGDGLLDFVFTYSPLPSPTLPTRSGGTAPETRVSVGLYESSLGSVKVVATLSPATGEIADADVSAEVTLTDTNNDGELDVCVSLYSMSAFTLTPSTDRDGSSSTATATESLVGSAKFAVVRGVCGEQPTVELVDSTPLGFYARKGGASGVLTVSELNGVTYVCGSDVGVTATPPPQPRLPVVSGGVARRERSSGYYHENDGRSSYSGSTSSSYSSYTGGSSGFTSTSSYSTYTGGSSPGTTTTNPTGTTSSYSSYTGGSSPSTTTAPPTTTTTSDTSGTYSPYTGGSGGSPTTTYNSNTGGSSPTTTYNPSTGSSTPTTTTYNPYTGGSSPETTTYSTGGSSTGSATNNPATTTTSSGYTGPSATTAATTNNPATTTTTSYVSYTLPTYTPTPTTTPSTGTTGPTTTTYTPSTTTYTPPTTTPPTSNTDVTATSSTGVSGTAIPDTGIWWNVTNTTNTTTTTTTTTTSFSTLPTTATPTGTYTYTSTGATTSPSLGYTTPTSPDTATGTYSSSGGSTTDSSGGTSLTTGATDTTSNTAVTGSSTYSSSSSGGGGGGGGGSGGTDSATTTTTPTTTPTATTTPPTSPTTTTATRDSSDVSTSSVGSVSGSSSSSGGGGGGGGSNSPGDGNSGNPTTEPIVVTTREGGVGQDQAASICSETGVVDRCSECLTFAECGWCPPEGRCYDLNVMETSCGSEGAESCGAFGSVEAATAVGAGATAAAAATITGCLFAFRFMRRRGRQSITLQTSETFETKGGEMQAAVWEVTTNNPAQKYVELDYGSGGSSEFAAGVATASSLNTLHLEPMTSSFAGSDFDGNLLLPSPVPSVGGFTASDLSTEVGAIAAQPVNPVPLPPDLSSTVRRISEASTLRGPGEGVTTTNVPVYHSGERSPV